MVPKPEGCHQATQNPAVRGAPSQAQLSAHTPDKNFSRLSLSSLLSACHQRCRLGTSASCLNPTSIKSTLADVSRRSPLTILTDDAALKSSRTLRSRTPAKSVGLAKTRNPETLRDRKILCGLLNVSPRCFLPTRQTRATVPEYDPPYQHAG